MRIIFVLLMSRAGREQDERRRVGGRASAALRRGELGVALEAGKKQ